MSDLEFYTPDDIPPHIRRHDSKVEQLGVGKAGKKGHLRMVFQKDSSGRTLVGEQSCQSPLFCQRPMYFEQSIPSLAHMYIMSSSGGMVQGDRYRIDIGMKRGAAAHVTTQGATRIYGMNSNIATQITNVCLDDDAYLELMPDQIIPYQGSRYYQRAEFAIHDGATMLYSEIITPGRVAMGESFEYEVCYLKTKVTNQDGRIRFIDVVNLEPKLQRLRSFGVLGRFSVVGNVYLFSRRETVLAVDEQIRPLVKDGILAGSSLLANDSGLLVRILADETAAVQGTVRRIAAAVRSTAIGGALSGIRKS